MRSFSSKFEVRVSPVMKGLVEELCEKLEIKPSAWIRILIERELVRSGMDPLKVRPQQGESEPTE